MDSETSRGQPRRGEAGFQDSLVHSTLNEGFGKHGHAVLAAIAVAHEDTPRGKANVLHAHLQTLHQSAGQSPVHQ